MGGFGLLGGLGGMLASQSATPFPGACFSGGIQELRSIRGMEQGICIAREKSFREELQDETNDWLKDI